MLIRAETANHRDPVRGVNRAAFPTAAEADLVDRLREHAAPVISLVAERDGQVVGHLMLSPVMLSGHAELAAMGLAPMAVVPQYQRQGVGSALVKAGLDEARRQKWVAVFVLGHPEYYPRFGFVPASRFGIECEYPVPDEAFMAIELEPGALHGKPGRVTYHAAFAEIK